MRLPGCTTSVAGTSAKFISSLGPKSKKLPPRSGSLTSTRVTLSDAMPTSTVSPKRTPKEGKSRESIHISPGAGTSSTGAPRPKGSMPVISVPRSG